MCKQPFGKKEVKRGLCIIGGLDGTSLAGCGHVSGLSFTRFYMNMCKNLLLASIVFILAACGGASSTDRAAPPPPAAPQRSLAAQAGEKIFNDVHLSGSTHMACATCHDSRFFHGPPNALAVQVGGVLQDQFGVRAAPSLRYLERTPGFSLVTGHAASALGGFTFDGRVNSLAAQARLPLFNPVEMANTDAEQLIHNVRASSYAALFQQAFGVADTETAVTQVQQALQAFQQEDPAFHPYDSKYDLFLAGKAPLSAAEQRGLQAFNDPARGNCAACHPATSLDGQPPLFTNFGYAATGVPRNAAIPKNADAAYFDLGLCGPLRTDLAQDALCGLFKTPTLRNVAQRPVFFHNGVIHSLEQAVRFYNTRDTNPEFWYPTRGGVALSDPAFPQTGLIKTRYQGGQLQKFDDLPARYQANLTLRAPLDGRAAGSTPPMAEQDVQDVVCFLQTLTDHFPPGSAPAAGCVN